MPPSDRRINVWLTLYHPVFLRRYRALSATVRELKERLPEEDYREHPTVKLFAAVRKLIGEIVPADPNAREYRLRKPLERHRRAKKRGLPARYRLLWVFSTTEKFILFTYLNDGATIRKEGAATDPYSVYEQMVKRGEIGDDFDTAYPQYLRAQGIPAPGESAVAAPAAQAKKSTGRRARKGRR